MKVRPITPQMGLFISRCLILQIVMTSGVVLHLKSLQRIDWPSLKMRGMISNPSSVVINGFSYVRTMRSNRLLLSCWLYTRTMTLNHHICIQMPQKERPVEQYQIENSPAWIFRPLMAIFYHREWSQTSFSSTRCRFISLEQGSLFQEWFKLSNIRLSVTCWGPTKYPRTINSFGAKGPLSHFYRVYTRLQQCGAQTT